MSTKQQIRKTFYTDEAKNFAGNVIKAREENDMDALNIIANPSFKLVENKRLSGMELSFDGYLPKEQFEDLRKMGWNYSSKFNKPYGKYWAKFNANLWNDTHELIEGGWLTVIADKPEPAKDYTHKPVLTQLSKNSLKLTGTRHFSAELHTQLGNLGWTYDKKSNIYTYRCSVSCKKVIARTQELLKDKQLTCNLLDAPASKKAKKSEPSAQIAMDFSPAVAEKAADFYSIFGE